ncbi:hypothetical protein [Nocardia sp. NPDC059229]|uniref:hypothetical protein n=1 Tax=Nocardia sp. NPDC059229 TaxID=3346778 RepID=UPI0036C76A2C
MRTGGPTVRPRPAAIRSTASRRPASSAIGTNSTAPDASTENHATTAGSCARNNASTSALGRGTDGANLSLRGVARDMGIVASAL